MKSTGIVRKLDPLGRIVIPIEIRKTLDLDNKPLEIFVENDMIILRKYEPSCIFCHNASDIVLYKGKNICQKCFNDIVSKDN